MGFSFAISVAVFIVGLCLYFLVTNPKVQEVGKIMFAVGLLVALLKFAGHASVQIGG